MPNEKINFIPALPAEGPRDDKNTVQQVDRQNYIESVQQLKELEAQVEGNPLLELKLAELRRELEAAIKTPSKGKNTQLIPYYEMDEIAERS